MIMFVDDEDGARLYVDEIRALKLPLEHFVDVDLAWEYVTRHGGEIKLAILDVMMPPRNAFDLTESEDGLCTGVLFYRRLRAHLAKVRVVLLTNRSADTVRKSVFGDALAEVCVKTEWFYDDFAERVRELYRSGT